MRHCCAWLVFGVLPPLARIFSGFMTSFWFLYEKMLILWFSVFFLDSGARAEEMLHVGQKALATGIVVQENFLVFFHHLLVNSTVSWQVSDLCMKNADSANFFSIAGLGRKKCCMWPWRHLPGALSPRSSFCCFTTIGSHIQIQRFHDKFLIFVWKNADSLI